MSIRRNVKSIIMKSLNKTYSYIIGGNKVNIEKVHRTKTQYEYFLTIFMGKTERFEHIYDHKTVFLTKMSALKHATYTILKAPQPKIERVY